MQVQIALEDESRSQADRAALKKQEAKLLKQHEKDWLGPLAAVTRTRSKFRSGMAVNRGSVLPWPTVSPVAG